MRGSKLKGRPARSSIGNLLHLGKLGTLPLPVVLSVAELFFRGKGREWMGVDESMGDEKG